MVLERNFPLSQNISFVLVLSNFNWSFFCWIERIVTRARAFRCYSRTRSTIEFISPLLLKVLYHDWNSHPQKSWMLYSRPISLVLNNFAGGTAKDWVSFEFIIFIQTLFKLDLHNPYLFLSLRFVASVWNWVFVWVKAGKRVQQDALPTSFR